MLNKRDSALLAASIMASSLGDQESIIRSVRFPYVSARVALEPAARVRGPAPVPRWTAVEGITVRSRRLTRGSSFG